MFALHPNWLRYSTWYLLFILIAMLALHRHLQEDLSAGTPLSPDTLPTLPAQVRYSPTLFAMHEFSDSVCRATLASLHPFNLNSTTEGDLVSMGIPHSAAARIVTHREKWGEYRYPKQLKRVYGIPARAADLIIPYAYVDRSSGNAYYFTPSRILFPFNPNTVTSEELLRLGFSQRAVDMVGKYRAKGGVFRKKEDFKRLYCVDSSTYALLEPHIQLPIQQNTPRGKRSVPYFTPPQTLFPFNPNIVTSEELLSLGFSQRAVDMIGKYRAKGGVFRKKEDFKRLYCVDSSTYALLEPHIQLPIQQNTTRGKRSVPYFTPSKNLFPFDPNTVTSEELLSLGFSQRAVEMIGKYRAKGGVFRRKEDFKRLYCVDSATYATLEPFIEVE